jgi:two-component system, cell cycle response regulator DivK
MERTTTILIAEDFEPTFNLLRTILERAGFQVLRAKRATDVLMLASERHPDLILMDVQLAEGNGMSAARMLREDPLTSSIPIIAMSALGPYELRRQAQAVGCDEYLAKPFRMADLAWRIQKVLGAVHA